MTKLFVKLGLTSIGLLVAMLPALAMAKTVVVGIEPAYAPWAYVEDGKYKGIAPDALRAMAKQQGFDITFKSLPFSSLIPALQANKIDVVATGFGVSKKRAKKVDFTIPWWQVNMKLLVKKDGDKNLVTGLCCGARVGLMSSTTERHWVMNDLKKNGVKVHMHTYPNDSTGIQDLMNGRLDSYLTDAIPALADQKHHSDKLRVAGTIINNPPIVDALGVRKGDTKLLALLNKAEVQLYKSGEWAKIIHKYVPSVSVGKIPAPMSEDIPTYKKPIPGLDN